MKLGQLAAALNCQLAGDEHLEIVGLAALEDAGPQHLTFLSNPKYARQLAGTRAAAVIIDDAARLPAGKSGLISPHPYLTFAEALQFFHEPLASPSGISPLAVVSDKADLGDGVSVGPFTVIGAGARIGRAVTIGSHCAIHEGAVIGEGSFIHSHCVVRERCRLGARVILQNNVVVGSDGFGYAPRPDRSWHKIPQTGVVVLEDDVEVGAGSVIDRATLGETRVEAGAKIDNLVQVGHGSVVGRHSLICAQAGLAGSTRVGREVVLGGQVGAAGHLTIGDRVVATAQTGIPHSVEPGRVISGYPAIENRLWLKASAVFAQLPRILQEFRQLKKQVAEIAARHQK
jgi:UDP-3-O-[3-hydroxymyristoyl] glucosamine N-acyltransferase